MDLEDYSEKSFVIRGENTKEYKDELIKFGGKWNPNLKDGGGWIFSSKNKEPIQEWLESVKNSKPNITVSDYSEKSFVVKGDTKKYKDSIKELGGKWNSNLKDGGGWIFSNSNRQKVDEWISKL